MIAIGAKTCRRCRERKEPEAFPRHARTKDGRSSWCSDCRNAARRGAGASGELRLSR